ncbi:hypothetical protein BJ878DRAFT_513928 [Calycina marina]|uniref:PhoD-like phosphatase domain-containing protein n=1 Tax=Calycina marina TaxID=1763456 RepID=A0A9P7YZY4_9HELO|nr:hypothetical protein BJ878DRAFT_513928 [Calycina marina]
MAEHLRDKVLHGEKHEDTHASASRWRHQESSSFAKHATSHAPTGKGDSNDLTNFLNSSRVEPSPQASGSTGPRYKPLAVTGDGVQGIHGIATQAEEDLVKTEIPADGHGVLEVKCGPLLNYRRMEHDVWFGSVLIVTKGGGIFDRPPPVLLIQAKPAGIKPQNGLGELGTNGVRDEAYGEVNGVDYSSFEDPSHHGDINRSSTPSTEETKIIAIKLYSDPVNTFWRFDLEVPMQEIEIMCEYAIPGLNFSQTTKSDKNNFYIPAIDDSMRIMFHSCNGFSVGTDEEAWSGAALWNDVQRVHKVTPFHVMLGGGDQIYNDGIRVDGPLREWSDIGIPKKRQNYPFPEELRRRCDTYYVENYIRWYGTEPFATANGQIAQLNLWDDHDIIDGFGSYTDEFMRCAVFRGIGGVANKYYLLFQHHLAPPATSFTSEGRKSRRLRDLPHTHLHATSDSTEEQALSVRSATARPGTTSTNTTAEVDNSAQLENTFVLKEHVIDSSYIIGAKPGPYVVDHSRSIYARLGARIAFFGIDARTERTRHQVNYPETYDIIFERLRKELGDAKASSPIKHLIILLGIPIAYPRLTWLENIFSSPLMGPLKFMNKRFGFGGGFFNKFDGNVDLLDDLDDHYTAKTHKKERLYLVQQLQALASEFSVRVSILSGDVHLAATGRFYSNPNLNIPIPQDHRYMVNVVSSAIVNKPPPQAVANLLARRNKIHHLDADTDETLMKMFDKDPGPSNKTSNSNHVTMPSRNWAMITENKIQISRVAHATNGRNGVHTNAAEAANGHTTNAEGTNGAAAHGPTTVKDGHACLHIGEVDAGTKHKAADSTRHGKDEDGGLDICIRVEIDQHDNAGKTQGYGLSVPLLAYNGAADLHMSKHGVRHPTADESTDA